MTTSSLRAFHKLRATAFVVLISLPSIDTLLHVDRTLLGDQATRLGKISLVVRDAASLKRLLGDVRAHLQRTFGFRSALVRAHGLLKVRGLGVSSSRQVLLGREGWLYLAGDGSLDDYRRMVSLSPGKLARYREVLAERKAWLAQRGADYVFFCAPSKHTVYPQYMPRRVKAGAGPSVFDQLQAAAGELALDLRPALFAAAKHARLYHLTDTHWNELGGLVAAGEVARKLSQHHPGLPALDLDQVERVPMRLPGGDLARMLGLKYDSHEQAWAVRFPGGRETLADGRPLEVSGIDVRSVRVVRLRNPSAPLRKAVVFRDSFGESLLRPLAQLFRDVVFVRTNEFDPGWIEAEAPNVVIQELVERRLLTLEPHDLAQERAIARTTASEREN